MRRTPKLTAEARRLFEEECLEYNGWQAGGTIPRIAKATGLTAEQVRDAIFDKSADKWRRELMVRMFRGQMVEEAEYDRMVAAEAEEAAKEDFTLDGFGDEAFGDDFADEGDGVEDDIDPGEDGDLADAIVAEPAPKAKRTRKSE